MKKLVCMILALSLVLSMTACGTKSPAETDPTTPDNGVETVAPDTTTATGDNGAALETVDPNYPDYQVDPSHEFHLPVTVTNNVVVEDSVMENSDFTFVLSYNDTMVNSDDLSVDRNIRYDMETAMVDIRAMADEILESMKYADANGEPLVSDGFVDYVLNPQRTDERVISFSGHVTSFANGALHPTTVMKGMNYDGTAGLRLTLWDVLQADEKDQVVKEMVLSKLADMDSDGSLGLFPEYPDAVESHFIPEDENSKSWYLNRDGMVVFFSAYELAPYATGAVEVTLTYAELEGILKEEFLPVENTAAADGDFVAYPAEDGSPNYVAVKDWDCAGVDLATTGNVRDVVVELVTSYDGENYTTLGTLFTASFLEGGKTVRLMVDLPDVIPNLRLTYTGANGTQVRYITQSGEDGSILLLEQ